MCHLRYRLRRVLCRGFHEPWRRNLAVLWLAQLFSVAGFNTILPFLPFYVQELGVTNPSEVKLWAGMLSSGPMIGFAVMAPIWGQLADRRGRKLMVLRASCGGTVVLALMGLATAPWHLLAIRVLQGLTTGVIAAITVLVSSMVPRKRVGFALGLMQTCVYLGGTIAPPLSGLLVDHHGYRVAAFVGASLLLTTVLLTLFGVHERFEPVTGGVGTDNHKDASPWQVFRSERALLGLAAMLLVVRLAQAFPQAVLPLFVQELSKVPGRLATVTGSIKSAAALAGALAAVTIGHMGDRIGHRRVLLYCLTGSAVFYLPQALVMNTTQLALLQFGLGFFVGGAVLALNALVARQSEHGREGANYGYVFSAGFIGLAAAPMLGSTVASAWSTRATLAVTAALFLLAAIWVGRGTSKSIRGNGAPGDGEQGTMAMDPSPPAAQTAAQSPLPKSQYHRSLNGRE
ncbi:MAG: MFS transporter [Anaerolineales bacterium]|nr:MAG: MFS transporter [Anaerolineales bacterium]